MTPFSTRPPRGNSVLDASLAEGLAALLAQNDAGRLHGGSDRSRLEVDPDEAALELPHPGLMIDGKRQLTRLIGSGSFGTVYEARQIDLGRLEAIKFLHGRWMTNAHHEVRVRFAEEARVMARMRGLHLVEVHDYGTLRGGLPYFVMEYLEGRPLRQRLGQGDMSLAEFLVVARQILEGLCEAHAHDVVHRDVKPENIFLGERRVKLLDFGLAKTSLAITKRNQMLGTPHYMAPELIVGGGRPDARTDIYAASAVMVEMLVGGPPFRHCGSDREALARAILHQPPPSLAECRAEIPRALGELIESGLAKQPENRPKSARAMVERLGEIETRWAEGERSMARPGRDSSWRGLGPGHLVDGRYAIERELGRGGMGVVYVATQVALRKQVALKIMTPSTSGDGVTSSERFVREARAASSIRHRNVIQVSDLGQLEDGSLYYAMELLHGRDLGEVLEAEGPLPWSRVKLLLQQILDGLSAVHEAGLVHRDVKPENIVLLNELDARGRAWVKLLDFGIAKVIDADAESLVLTETSEAPGTVSYMAPEVIRGERPDAQSDLYAVGIVAFELLTGSVPFDDTSTQRVLLRHLEERPAAMHGRGVEVSRGVEAFVRRALAKAAADRYRSAAEMRAALDVIGEWNSRPRHTGVDEVAPLAKTALDRGRTSCGHAESAGKRPREAKAQDSHRQRLKREFSAIPLRPRSAPMASREPWLFVVPILAMALGVIAGLLS